MLSSHDRQSTPSSAPEVNTPGGLLTIGELARRAGVTASAMRYYEELGLLPAPARVSGQRRYPESAARLVAAILLYSDAGFTLAEQKALMATRASTPGDRRQLMQRKLVELDEQIARAQAAREAISHGLRCPTRTSRNAPTSTPASPPGSPASHCHNPTSSCTADGSTNRRESRAGRPGGLRAVGRVAIGSVTETGTIRAPCFREPRLPRESQAVTGKA